MAAGNNFSGSNDYNALFYHPAALARLKEGEINMGIQFGLTPTFQTLAKDIETASQAKTENEKISSMIDLLYKQYGNNYSLKFPQLGGIWARPGWAIGIIPVDLTLNTEIHQGLGPALGVSAYQDSTVAFGYAKSFLEEKLSVGLTAKTIYRGYVGKDLLALDLVSNPNVFQKSDAKEGLTVDADVSALYDLPTPEDGFFSFLKVAKPSVSLAVRNIFDFGFKQNLKLYSKETSGQPPKLQRRVDVGSVWNLPTFWVFTPRFMFDVRDILHDYWTFSKGLHLGAELEWNAYSWLRGYYSIGLSQLYLTAGVGAELGWFRLDAVTYGEEVGTTDAKKENRIYMAKLSLDF
jgi:hypothetical protein